MAEYDALRQRHNVRLLELMPGLFERLTAPPEQLAAARTEALRALLADVKARSPWHRARLARCDPSRARPEDLTALPPMTKNDLMEHFDAIVTDPRLTRDVVEAHLDGLTQDAYLLDEFHACASGGSSGRRGVFVYDFDAWALTFASYIRFSLRLMQTIFPAEPPLMAMVAADKATHMTSAMAQTFSPPAGGAPRRCPATWPLERIVAALNALQPTYLLGYASMVHQLTHEAVAGRLRIAPKLVACTSEPLLSEVRAAIKATWNAAVANGFGSTEGLMGGSCSAERGIHLSDDLFIIEPVDERGMPVPRGQRAAKLYLTSLVNRIQPLIRYELTDEVTVLDEPCPCGATLLRIDDIQGRTDDRFVYPGGIAVHPLSFRSVLGRERAVIEYQVRQTPAGADVLVCAEEPVDTTRLAAALEAELAALGLPEPEVRVRAVTQLDRQATGKLRRFVPLPPAG